MHRNSEVHKRIGGTSRKRRLFDLSTNTVEVSLLGLEPAEKSGQKVVLHGAGTAWSFEQLFFLVTD